MALAQANAPQHTLLGIDWDARHLILQNLLLVEENRVEEPVEEFTPEKFHREFWADAARYKAIKCEPQILNTFLTCRQLYQESAALLLGKNKFVAIVGRKVAIVEKLKEADMLAFWTPPWTWNHAEGMFNMGNHEYRPELTISFTHYVKEIVLLPACDVAHAFHAIHRTEPFQAATPTGPSPHIYIDLTFKFEDEKTILNKTKEDAVKWLGANAFWLCAKYVNSIRVFPRPQSEEREKAAATALKEALQLKCAKERERSRIEQARMLHRRMKPVIIEMEKAIVAKDPEKAMQAFCKVANWVSLFFEEVNFQDVHSMEIELRNIRKMYSHACYWIGNLDRPCRLGWSDDYYDAWALRRMRVVHVFWSDYDPFGGLVPSSLVTSVLTWPGTKVTNTCAQFRTLELMIRSKTCGWSVNYRMLSMAGWAARGDDGYIERIVSADSAARNRSGLRLWDCPGCSKFTTEGTFQPRRRCVQRTYTPAEQQSLLNAVAWLKARSNNLRILLGARMFIDLDG